MTKPKNNSGIIFTGLAVLVCIISAAVIWNILRIQTEIDDRTQKYVVEGAEQLAEIVDERVNRCIVDLKRTRDYIQTHYQGGKDQDGLKTYVDQRTDALMFQSIIVSDREGSLYQSGPALDGVEELPGVQAALAGTEGVSVLRDRTVIYSVPVYREGQVVGVLSGVRSREYYDSESFSGRKLVCVVEPGGSVVISPKDGDMLQQLSGLFTEQSKHQNGAALRQIETEVTARQKGSQEVRMESGERMLLSYAPMEHFGWVLLTLIPSNVLSFKMDQYMGQTLFVVLIGVALMMVLLALLYRTRRLRYVDRVTGGMNNLEFQIRCRAALEHAQPSTASIVLLNIKSFKLINEMLGKQAGDWVLSTVMSVLKKHMKQRDGCFAARGSADIFYLFLTVSEPEEIQRIIDEIVKDVDREVEGYCRKQEKPFKIILQFGAYIVDEPWLDVIIMQDRARVACRSRESIEDGVCKFYSRSILIQLTRQQEVQSWFEQSLKNHDFKVYLQPKIRTSNGGVGGAEALVRWQHPEKGLIPPGDFIPVFEENGSVCELDRYVFREVCQMLRRWIDTGRDLFPVSVNLSRRHFQLKECLEPFIQIADQYQIPHDLIEFEVTESIFFDSHAIEEVKVQSQRAQQLGFRFSMDDFGAGYSSLGLLMQFNMDVIKMDKQFFQTPSKSKTRMIVAAIVKLVRDLGAETVAEGIETPEQLALMKEVECELVQGYIYAKPMPIPEFEEWVNGRMRREVSHDKAGSASADQCAGAGL